MRDGGECAAGTPSLWMSLSYLPIHTALSTPPSHAACDCTACRSNPCSALAPPVRRTKVADPDQRVSKALRKHPIHSPLHPNHTHIQAILKSYPGLHALSTPFLSMPLPTHPITPLLWRGSGAGPSSLARRCSCCSSAACCPEPAHYRPRRPRQRRPAHRHLCRRSHPRPRIARSLAGGLVTAPRLEGSGIPTSCTRRVLTTQPITCSAYMCSMHA